MIVGNAWMAQNASRIHRVIFCQTSLQDVEQMLVSLKQLEIQSAYSCFFYLSLYSGFYQAIIQYQFRYLDHGSILGDCSCNNYVSDLGYGKCEKDFRGGPVCYVDQPSACTDVADSKTEPGMQYSWEACSRQNFQEIIIPSKCPFFIDWYK